MSEAPKPGEFRKDSERRHTRRASLVFNVLETVIRRTTYLLLALGGLAASLKLLRDVITPLFRK